MRKFLISLALLLCFAVTVCASDNTFVTDDAGILSAQELYQLESAASAASRDADCGIYVYITQDFTDYGTYDVERASELVYDAFGMGLGENRDGILLLLSLDDRDYTIYSGSAFAKKTLNDYAAADLSLAFLDDFRGNDWYTGLYHYVTRAGEILTDAQHGKVLTVNSDSGFVTAGIIALLAISGGIGGIVILVLNGQMKSVALQHQAMDYVPQDGLHVTQRSDTFTHTTRTRRKIETNSGGGSSGGHSHTSTSHGGSRTGKF